MCLFATPPLILEETNKHLYSTYMYLVVLHNIHNQLPQLIRRVATVLHTVVHVHLCTAF